MKYLKSDFASQDTVQSPRTRRLAVAAAATLSADSTKAGSALILTVVLTSLLGIVGVMFVMMARIDNMSTSALAENKQFNHAVDAVLERIKQVLANDVPGMVDPIDPNVIVEYYDYPHHRLCPGKDTFYGTWDDVAFGWGEDRIYGTDDDDDWLVYPGPDGFYGTGDDTRVDPGADTIFGTDDDIAFGGGLDDWWLASLEPEVVDYGWDKGDTSGTVRAYGWRHITDLYGQLAFLFQLSCNYETNTVKDFDSDGDRISFRNLRAVIIDPSDPIGKEGDKADADGDGVADSRWVIVPDIKTSKGEDVYAAVRIIDNGGMLNVNTAFRFDPNDPALCNGANQMQINLAALAARGSNPSADLRLHEVRCAGWDPPRTLHKYIWQVVWYYEKPHGLYTPFDIADELKLRYRYILNYNKMTSRIEELWTKAYKWGIETPLDKWDDVSNPKVWFYRAKYELPDPLNENYEKYDYRHISTMYNMDRVIDANGFKMFNVNFYRNIDTTKAEVDTLLLFRNLLESVDPVLLTDAVRRRLAQFAVNLMDFADEDTEVTSLTDPYTGERYYGFEVQPFISELGMKIAKLPGRKDAPNYYAVELYNPFDKPVELSDFLLIVGKPSDPCDPDSAAICCINLGDPNYFPGQSSTLLMPGQCRVIANNPAAFVIDSNDPNNPTEKGRVPGLKFYKWVRVDPRFPATGGGWPIWPGDEYMIGDSYPISVVRRDNGLYVDRQQLPRGRRLVPRPEMTLHLLRNMKDWRIVYPHLERGQATMGLLNSLVPAPPAIYRFSLALGRQRSPSLWPGLLTIGDVPQILTIGPQRYPHQPTMGEQLLNRQITEPYVRLNLQDPRYANIFQYLTCVDPSEDGIDNDWDDAADKSETQTPELKVPGRININTAPWFVIAQLPWMTPPLAQAIVAYRDKLNLTAQGGPNYLIDSRSQAATEGILPLREELGFASIGELNFVSAPGTDNNLDYVIQGDHVKRTTPAGKYTDGYHPDGVDLELLLDLTRVDGITDDFEERDVIFSRISNLVTVRSDVFTAYVLVRVGRDGPQRRIMAILNRGDMYRTGGKVKLRAVQQVPDPR